MAISAVPYRSSEIAQGEDTLSGKSYGHDKRMKEFTGPHQVSMEGWISCAPFESLLRIKIVEAGDGRSTLTMPFLVDFAQGAGIMHGGALVALADTAVVMAIKSVLPPNTHFATISVEAKFLYPVKEGMLCAEAQIVGRDGKIVQGRATIYNESKRPVVEFSSTFKMARDATIRKARDEASDLSGPLPH